MIIGAATMSFILALSPRKPVRTTGCSPLQPIEARQSSWLQLSYTHYTDIRSTGRVLKSFVYNS